MEGKHEHKHLHAHAHDHQHTYGINGHSLVLKIFQN